MADILLKAAVYGGPLFLGLMGVYVTFNPPGPHKQKIWFGVFCVITVFSIATAVWDSERTDRRLEELISGRNDYFYFVADFTLGQTANGEFPLRAVTSGKTGVDAQVWISPAEIKGNAKDPRYWIGAGKGLLRMSVPAGAYLSGVTLPIGEWRIECTAKNAGWVQILKIFKRDGKLAQSIKVIKDGVVVLRK